MPIIYDWDFIVRGYEAMFEQCKNAQGEHTRNYAIYAQAMLKLIPLIRVLPELENFRLDMSMGRLMLWSKSDSSRLLIGYGNSTYVVHLRRSTQGSEISSRFDSEQIIAGLLAI